MEIVSLSVDELQRIEPLWKELIAFLHRQSTRFKMEFEQKQFASRIQTYLDKVKDGKYLIDENGHLAAVMSPRVLPNDISIINWIEGI